jgi:hypothetical protein
MGRSVVLRGSPFLVRRSVGTECDSVVRTRLRDRHTFILDYGGSKRVM